MTNGRRGTSFSQESLSRRRKPRQLRSPGFHGNDPLQLGIVSPEDDAHSTTADLFKDLIRAKLAQRARQCALFQILANRSRLHGHGRLLKKVTSLLIGLQQPFYSLPLRRIHALNAEKSVSLRTGFAQRHQKDSLDRIWIDTSQIGRVEGH
jgi:hypothetical protein